jgi:sulfate-transporting ATPase
MASGSLIALVALGVVMAYRASGVLNFSATGAGALAAFLFYELRDNDGWPVAAALMLSLCLGAVLGAMTQVIVLRVLRKLSTLQKVIATLALMTWMQGVVYVIWGSAFLGQPTSILPSRVITLPGNITIGEDRLIIIGIAMGLAVILKLVYSRTLFGLATSAVSESRDVASMGGWSPSLIELVNFTIAGALSAGAAILLVPIVGLEADTLTLLIIPALAAALVGRFSLFGLTVVAALAIGIMQIELSLYLNDIANWLGFGQPSISGLPDAVPILVIIIATIATGRGRLGRGEMAAKLPLPGSGRVAIGPLVIAVTAVAIGLFTLPTDWVVATVTSLVTAVLILSVVVVTGYAGQLSLAQFALAGFGGWVAARSFAALGLPFEVALLFGVVTTIPVGLVVALPALRTRGANLAVATLGLALMLYSLIFNDGAITGGATGTVLMNPTLFGIQLDPVTDPKRYGLLVLAVLVVVGLGVANLRRGHAGRRLLAVRSNERAAASLGVSVYGAKLYAFGLGAAIAGLSGILFAFSQTYVNFDSFNVLGSITVVQFAIVGGIAWASGAGIGTMLAAGGLGSLATTHAFGNSNWVVVLTGVLVLVVMRAAPDGSAQRMAERLRPVTGRLTRSSRPPATEVIRAPRDRQPATLVVDSISVRFGGVVALDNVSLDVRPGEVVGLIGPNGAGKTTMLDVITGFTRPSAGRVLLGGQATGRWTPERRARAGIARSWQAVELFEEMTVEENLLVGADRQELRRYLGDLVHPGRPVASSVMEEVIDEFGLRDKLGARPSALSQGQTRLAGIARAICMEPTVLLLDEPAAGLDVNESREFGTVIRRVARHRGVGILLVEHDVPLLMATCDRIFVLDFGQLIAEGTPAEIRCNPRVVKAYLGADLDLSDPVAGTA